MSRGFFQTVHDRVPDSLKGKRFAVNLVNFFVVKFTQYRIQIPCDCFFIFTGSDIFYDSVCIIAISLICCDDADPFSLPDGCVTQLSDCKNFFFYISLNDHQFCFRRVMAVFHSRRFRRLICLSAEKRLVNTDMPHNRFHHICGDRSRS